jgi:RNA polymerase sigma factor (sigma-70 family)
LPTRATATDGREADDSVLLQRVAQNDEQAFTALVLRYQNRFYSVARRMLGNEHDSEDAVQLAFLRVFRSAAEYRDEWRGSTWLYRILTNVCIDAWRKRGHETTGLTEAVARTSLLETERIDLEAALVRLPTEARAIFLLRYMEDLPYDEIARIRGITINTVKTQLRRSKQSMRSYLTLETGR